MFDGSTGGTAHRPPGRVPAQRSVDLRSAFEFAPIGIAVLTPDGVITTCNPALGELLAREPDDLVGTTLFEVTHPQDLPTARLSCDQMRCGRARIVRHECRFVRRDGSVVWVSVSTARVPAAGERPAHLVMHIEDVDERKALEARLLHLASHDPLTGLANRLRLQERIDHALRSDRDAPRSCLLYLDLDDFKQVNDRFGHAVGDRVLQEFATRITGLISDGDTAARLGGDEFAVLCPGGQADAEVLADRLRQRGRPPVRHRRPRHRAHRRRGDQHRPRTPRPDRARRSQQAAHPRRSTDVRRQETPDHLHLIARGDGCTADRSGQPAGCYGFRATPPY